MPPICTSEMDSTPDADRDIGAVGHDLLRRHGDGVEARGAIAVDGDARGGHRAAGPDREFARDIVAGGAFGHAAAHDRRLRLRPDRCPALAMACLTAWPPITAPWVWLKLPRTDLARPVRAVETMTACLMAMSSGVRANASPKRPAAQSCRQPLGRQRGIAQGEGDGDAQRHHADRDADIKRHGERRSPRASASAMAAKAAARPARSHN